MGPNNDIPENKRVIQIEKEESNFLFFWYSEIVNKSGDLRWKIDHLKLIAFIRSKGFRRFDIGKDYIFVKIVDKVIEEVTATNMQDMVFSYLESLTFEMSDKEKIVHESGITHNELLSKFYTSPTIYFNDRKLSTLGIEPNLKMNSEYRTKNN